MDEGRAAAAVACEQHMLLSRLCRSFQPPPMLSMNQMCMVMWRRVTLCPSTAAAALVRCWCACLCVSADSEVRQVQRDHDAAEKKLGELKAEKERVTRQVGGVGCGRGTSKWRLQAAMCCRYCGCIPTVMRARRCACNTPSSCLQGHQVQEEPCPVPLCSSQATQH